MTANKKRPEQEQAPITILLVDDEEEFRRATRPALERRGFRVIEAAGGAEGLAALRREKPNVVLLDLKMPGLGGIETLTRIREIDPALPVIILTGHGSFDDALAGIRLDIVDFVQKPVDVDLLSRLIRELLAAGGRKEGLRERTIAEIMVPADHYPKLYADQPIAEALRALKDAFFQPATPDGEAHRIRSARVYDRAERFIGLVRFSDMLKLVLPSYLSASPYTTYFTGMFLAQAKVIGLRSIAELLGEPVSVALQAPLMEAVSLMVQHHLITLPVMDKEKLTGVLRERDIVLEIVGNLGVLSAGR